MIWNLLWSSSHLYSPMFYNEQDSSSHCYRLQAVQQSETPAVNSGDHRILQSTVNSACCTLPDESVTSVVLGQTEEVCNGDMMAQHILRNCSNTPAEIFSSFCFIHYTLLSAAACHDWKSPSLCMISVRHYLQKSLYGVSTVQECWLIFLVVKIELKRVFKVPILVAIGAAVLNYFDWQKGLF